MEYQFEYANNFGAVRRDGTPLYDAQEQRTLHWVWAKQLLGSVNSVYQNALLRVAEQAATAQSSKKLDALEAHWLGSPLTSGSHPKRQRFYRFLALQARGIVPHDLRNL